MSLLELTDCGLFCRPGGFHVDPWRPVERAVVTHAHGDHLRWGSRRYLVAQEGETVTRARLGEGPLVEAVGYGETVSLDGVRVSLHPAGHVLGSAQVRIEYRGEVWVVSGDYKTAADPTCTPFEPVRCHAFVTESTFGLPIYRWEEPEVILAEVNDWWRANREAGKASLLYAYALGKSQRLLSGLDPSIGLIFTHGAVEKLVRAYRAAGVPLPATRSVFEQIAAGKSAAKTWAGSLVLAPPSAHGSTWTRRFSPSSSAVASGWMRIRGTRRRRSVDRGFVLSDHADWPGLLDSIRATRAERIWVTHGYTAVVVRWLREQGLDAQAIATRFEGEMAEEAADPAETAEGIESAETAEPLEPAERPEDPLA